MAAFYGRVEPQWDDDLPVAVVGGGQSLVGFDFERLRGHARVVAVKGCIFDLPWADCGAGADFPRLESWLGKLNAVTMPVYWGINEPQWKQKNPPKPPCITFVRQEYGNDLSVDPSFTYRGGTSGFHALNVAVLKGMSRPRDIFLFGFDYRSGSGQYHHNEQHYNEERPQSVVQWKTWAQGYAGTLLKLKALNMRVFNASPESTITCFEKMTPDEAVQHILRLGPEGGSGLRGGPALGAAAPVHSNSDPGPSS